MSVFPPGETNSKVPPWATASRPEQPTSRVANIAPAIASRHMVMAPLSPASGRCPHRTRRSASSPARSNARRLEVLDVDQAVAVVDQGGDRAQRAFASPRVVPEALAAQVQPQRPYRQLVADAHHLMAGAAGPRLVRRSRHPCRDLRVRLPPRRGERVAQLPPEPRVAPGTVAGADAPALEEVGRFDQIGVGVDGQVVL